VSKKIVVFVCLAVAVALVAGCAANPALYRKVPFPVGKIIKAGPVFQVRIKAEPAVSKLAIGQSVVLTATAVDENSRKVTGAEFTWKCDSEGKLSATAGKSVTFTLLTKPDVACFVTAKSNGEEGIISIEGK
jgi:protocatechuate 3,4-dioxygenase beta subunit